MTEIDYGQSDMLEEALWQPKWYHRIALNILKCGQLPKHIAVIMDGNRRWAADRARAPIFGHTEGVKTLDLCNHWMEAFGIREITVYAFSTDNFKRDQSEVDQLMDLITRYLRRVLDKQSDPTISSSCVKIYGNMTLLPPKLRTLAAKVVLMTQNNKSEEMDTVIKTLQKAVAEGDLLPEDIDEIVIERCMYTADGSSPELLIRTSGEQRYSDFFMWQLMRKPLFFCDSKWPDFGFGNFCRAIYSFQRYFANCDKVQSNYDGELKRQSEKMMSDADEMARDARIDKFFEKRDRLYMKYLQDIVDADENE